MSMDHPPIRIEAAGAGIVFLRIVRDITAHFPVRRSEWVTAGMMLGWGLIVGMSFPIFNQSPAWAVLGQLASENVWAAIATSVGILRLVALILNGTFWQTWYGRWSPHIRATGCFASCLVWLAICLGLFASPHITTGLPIYGGLVILDAMNGWSAARDAGRMDGARSRADSP